MTTGQPQSPFQGTEVPGIVQVSSRALEQVARAVAASALGVTAGEVRVTLSDLGGDIAVDARSPIQAQGAETLIRQAHRARHTIAERIHDLTGARVRAVSLDLGAVQHHAAARVS